MVATSTANKGTNVSTTEVATVRVWFGDVPIRSLCTDDPQRADEYVAAMARQFAGLRITVDHRPPKRRFTPLPANPDMWPLTVK